MLLRTVEPLWEHVCELYLLKCPFYSKQRVHISGHIYKINTAHV